MGCFTYTLSVFARTNFNIITESINMCISDIYKHLDKTNLDVLTFTTNLIRECWINENLSDKANLLVQYWTKNTNFYYNILAMDIYCSNFFDYDDYLIYSIQIILKNLSRYNLSNGQEITFGILLLKTLLKILNFLNNSNDNQDIHFLLTCMNMKNRDYFHEYIELTIRFSVDYYVTHSDGLIYPAVLYKYALNKDRRPLIIRFFKICLQNPTTNQAVLYFIEKIANLCKNKQYRQRIFSDFINNLLLEAGDFYRESINKCVAEQGGI